MSSKVKTIIIVIVTALLVSGIWFFVMFMRTKSISERLEGEIASLTATLDALGPNVTCYTVTEEYVNHYDNDTTGQIIQENSLQPIEVPSSLVGDAYVTSTSDIVGKYFKVNVVPGTPITTDLIMAEKYDDTLRDTDIVVNSWVVGLREGDYVDIRITFPFGEDYIVLPHKRVQRINDKTLKMYLTESEQAIYTSALVDYYLNESNGARIYITKYVEPGVQQPAEAFYAPSTRVETAMRTDPNIVDKAEITALMTFRPAIDQNLNQFIDERTTVQSQAGLISGGRDSLSSDIQSDYNSVAREYEDMEDEEDTYEEEEVAISFEESPEETEVDETEVEETEPTVEETEVEETEPTVEPVVEETEPTVEETTHASVVG